MITAANDLNVLLKEEEIQKRISELATEINQFYNGEEITLLCVLKGAVMFMVELSKHLKMPVKMEFIKLSSYGTGTTSSGKVQSFGAALPELREKHVLIVEDIIDTGLSAKYLTEYLQENFQPKTLKFCSLLNKQGVRRVDIEPDFYGFKIDNKFVVGYGLDDEEYNRNLTFIGYKEV